MNFDELLPHPFVPASVRRNQDVIDLVFDLTGGQGFICGGFARYALSPVDKPVVLGDIDVYCGTQEVFMSIADRFRCNPACKQRGASEIEVKYDFMIEDGYEKHSYSIQLIRPIAIFNMVSDGDWTNVLKHFDFTIAMCAILPNGKAYKHSDFDHHEIEQRLVINNIHCPISSTMRVIKYTKRGYVISSQQLLLLFLDYESRSPEWKALVQSGFNDEFTRDPEAQKKFLQTVYLD